MPRIKNIRPDRPVGTLPVERIVRIGRRMPGKAYPERLDHMEVCLPGVDPDDEAGNRAVDHELMTRLLAEQAKVAPEEPSDKLRCIRVHLAPTTLDGIFGSEFRCRTEDGMTVVCKGDGDEATHRHRWDEEAKRWAPLNSGLVPVDGKRVAIDGVTQVRCAGVDCGFYARQDATGKRAVYPRCAAEWELRMQLAAMESTFGIVRFRSKSIIGLDETQGVIDEVEQLVTQERVPSLSSVPLLLRMKNTRTGHSKAGVWTVYLGFHGPALAMIQAAQDAYDEGRVLGGGRPARQLDPHEEPLVRPSPVASDVADAEPAEEYEDAEVIEGEAPPPEQHAARAKPREEAKADRVEAKVSEETAPPTAGDVLREQAAADEPPEEQPATDAPSPSSQGPDVWARVRAVAVELEGDDEQAIRSLITQTFADIRADDPDFPAAVKGEWHPTEDQLGQLLDTMRGISEMAAEAA